MSDHDCPPAADDGHLWLVSAKCLLGSSIVTGDAHHRDAPAHGDRAYAVRVRAWSLAAAIEVAQGYGFVDFMSRDSEGRFCGMVDADSSTAPKPEGKVGYCGPRCIHCMGDDGRPVFALNADGVWACHADSDVMDES